MNVYSIQEWLFNTANGRFDIDLAESGIQFQTLSNFSIDTNMGLDYSLDRGLEALRIEVAGKYGTAFNQQNVVITHGGQEALYTLYQSVLSAGDGVITTLPGWQQSWEVPHHIGATVDKIECVPGQPFPVEALAARITERTRLVVLNYPNNPMGTDISEAEWQAIIKLCQAHDIIIVNDEEYLIDFKDSIVNKYKKGISISSLSKIHGLPALRIGWAVGDRDIIERMVNYKRYTTVSNSYLCEQLALQALRKNEWTIQRYNTYIQQGYKVLKAFVNNNDDLVTLIEPENTPFAWLNLKGNIDSMALAEKALAEHRLLVMPAEVFGAQHGLRITYARDVGLLTDAFSRLQKVFDHYKRENS